MKIETTTAGSATTEKKLERKGYNPQVFSDTGETTLIGPFTTEAVHAEVEGNVRVTLSENYHSLSLGVTVRIPVEPTHDAVQQGMDYCFKTANDFLEKEMAGAREELKKAATRR